MDHAIWHRAFRCVELLALLLALASMLNAAVIWRRRCVFHLNLVVIVAHLVVDGIANVLCKLFYSIQSWTDARLNSK